MNESTMKPTREEKAAARREKKKATLAEIKNALPEIYDFFMEDLKPVFEREAKTFLQKKKELRDELSSEDLWNRYEYFICSKLRSEKRPVFMNHLTALPPGMRMEFLKECFSHWMANVFFQALSDKKRMAGSESSANLYHRLQQMIRKYRPENLYFKGRWYGRANMNKDDVLQFEKNQEKDDGTRSFIASLPPLPGMNLQHFYNREGRKFRFEGFGRAIDEILQRVQEKSGSQNAAFLLFHFMCWFTRHYWASVKTVSDNDGQGSLIDKSQVSSSAGEEAIFLHEAYEVMQLLKKKLDSSHRRLLELKISQKTARQIVDEMHNGPLKLNNDSAVSYHYKKIQAVADECFAKLTLPTGKKAFKYFIAICQYLDALQK